METILKKVFRYALERVDPCRLVLDNLRLDSDSNCLYINNESFHLDEYAKIHVIAVGKGAPFLFEGLDRVLGSRISGGVVVSLEEHAFLHPRVAFCAGSHPIPDQKSLDAGRAVFQYIEELVDKDDLVFFLITGGASALMVLPAPGISLEDKMEINRLLLSSGAEINEINCVRKQLSALKGGKLARMVAPASLISLILSDIVDSPLGAIGSGPSIPDTASAAEANSLLANYGLIEKAPPAVRGFLKQSVKDTEVLPLLENNRHFLLADNRVALEAAQACAQEMGLQAQILTSRDKGEVSEAAKMYAAIIKEIVHTHTPFKPPVLLLGGGELTVTLSDTPGMGGRNQEFVLHMMQELKSLPHPYQVASIGTDGIDGPTDAAGAWIDKKSHQKAKRLHLDPAEYLQNHDSYHFFKQMDQLITTGPTRTNVMDIRLFYLP